MALAADLRSLIERALDSDDWFTAATALRDDQAPEQLPPPVAAIIDAFSYALALAHESSRDQWGEFVPMFSGEGFSYPPVVELVIDARLEEWAELMEELRHPLIQSRLGDLLWLRRHGAAPHDRCREAIQGYLKLGRSPVLDTFHRTVALIRANELAFSLNDGALIESTISELLKAAGQAVTDKDPAGITVRLLVALNQLPKSRQPRELDDLLERAQERLAEDPFTFESIVTLQIGRAAQDAERKFQLVELLVDRWERQADASGEMLKAHNLERALQLASNHGLTERANKLRVVLQQISEEGLGLKTLSSTVSVPTNKVEEYIAKYVEDGEWRASLQRFGAHCPVASDRAQAELLVRQIRQETPLASRVARRVMGPGGVHIRTFSTDEELLNHDMTRQEVINISWWGILATEILDRILGLVPAPSDGELVEFFQTSSISASVAKHIARAVVLYRDGNYDESLLILLPRIEAIVREMSRQMGLVIIREPRGGKPGGFASLGDLLRGMRVVLAPESVEIYLFTLLTDPVGINLRNDALHGLMEEGTKAQSALALHAVCLLRLFRLRSEAEEEGE